MKKEELLRKIPSVDEILSNKNIQLYIEEHSHYVVVKSIRIVLNDLRKMIKSKPVKEHILNSDNIVDEVAKTIKKEARYSLRKVINATGVVLHTNLGRSPLSGEAKKRIIEVTEGYSNLEFDFETGKRGSRYFHLTGMLKELTGAEEAFVVNNNAAAVFLALSTFARGKEVIVSRGELIEIGGSFRLPEIMKLSGARLVEVGATNKTYEKDYRNAINENTSLLMKVHPSNFRIKGFFQETSLSELFSLGKEFDLPVMYDAGSGAFVDLSQKGLSGEPTVQQSLKEGADIITFSGDKLLGGPQAGIIIGKKKYLEQMKKNHLTRALRVCKMTIAALEATLRIYLEGEAWERIPVLERLSENPATLKIKAKRFKRNLNNAVKNKGDVKIEESTSESGGGALPTIQIPTLVVTLSLKKLKSEKIGEKLRGNEIPIIVRIADDKVVFDLRTIGREEEKTIINAIKNLVV
ncbi:MAG: L-seryl-tRNA(Sec) selenium transferase [Actinomycetia bacterium]|nr:L-seryl-tRNA(Sec) selenium transferase [Actinomycetes bacterium]